MQSRVAASARQHQPSQPPLHAATATVPPHHRCHRRSPAMTVAAVGTVPPARPKHATATPLPAAATAKLFSFGLLSDVQHADKEDGFSFHGTPRFYRYALEQLDRAVDAMLAADVEFCIHLGDIIDYHNSVLPPCEVTGLSQSEKALRAVLAHFDRLAPRPTLHLLGNHCLYNHRRPQLNARLGISALQRGVVPHSYYAFQPVPGWRFILLDGYDVSILGWPQGHPLHEQAHQVLVANNPNEDKNSAAGLVGLQRRFVKFGGGVSVEQLAWLQGQLEAAAAAGERVICCCHLCFHPDTCAPPCLLWNYDAVLEVLQRYSGTVVATLAGHAHQDGFARDGAGIQHRVCKAVLETPPGRECYAVVDVFQDRIVINGVDTFASEEWALPAGATSPPAAEPAAAAEPARCDAAVQALSP